MNATKALLKMNCENIGKIDKKYDPLMTEVIVYIRVKLNEKDAEEAINDILAILLEAQERGEDLAMVLGEDYRAFCDAVVGSYKENRRMYGLTELPATLKTAAAMLPLFIAVSCLTDIGKIKPWGFENFWSQPFTLTPMPIITCAISVPVAYLILHYIAQMGTVGMGENKNKVRDFMVLFAVQCVFIAITVGIALLIRNVVLLKLPHYSIWMVLSAVTLGIYVLHFKKTLKTAEVSERRSRL